MAKRVCPRPEELRQFAEGRLALEQAAILKRHLDECSACAGIASAWQKYDQTKAQSEAPTLPPVSAVDPSGDTAVRAPAEAAVAAAAARDFAFLAPPQSPDELGRLGPYRVLKLLGQGGMGVVFLAQDTRLDRLVALKVMRPEMALKAEAKERFVRKAKAAAALEHDHIVAIYQVDEDRGVPYIAMPLLKGLSLEEWLRRREQGSPPAKPRLAEIFKVGREIARGLAAAHARGLIHRDIKPANIWLDGSAGGRVKILDFGLARATTSDQDLTQTGMILGTPAFMAPEQAQGQKTDARADLFSLGVVLYRLSTGWLPFQGSDVISTLMALATHEPAAPHLLNPDIPAGLSDLVLRLLEKDPARRFATAQEVVKAIQALEKEQTNLPTLMAVEDGPAGMPAGATVAVPPEDVPPEPVKDGRPATYGRNMGCLVALGLLVLIGAGVSLALLWKPEDGGATPEAPTSLPTNVNSLGMKLVQIPAGKFFMGSPASESERNRDEEQHEVVLTQPFFMAAHEVTVGQFKAFVKAVNYTTDAEKADKGNKSKGALRRFPDGTWKRDPKANWLNPGFEQTDGDPVVCVSWEDAAAFCHWLSLKEGKQYTLPTEAQWEYCCRAGTLTKFAAGDSPDLDQAGWYQANSEMKTHPVGQKQANAWGLFDMHGNAWEWTANWYDANYYQKAPRVDPWGPAGSRVSGSQIVSRGGSFASDDGKLRSALRRAEPNAEVRADLGFRVTCAVPEPSEGPSPFDRLRADDIPPDKRTLATLLDHSGTGQVDGELPTGLVAVRGDGTFSHWAKIRVAVFGPDGNTVASWGDDNVVQLWAFPSGKLLRRWGALGLAGSGDGKILAIPGPKGRVMLWDLARDGLLRTLIIKGKITVSEGKVALGQALALDRIGSTLAVSTTAGVLLFDTARPKEAPRRVPGRLAALSADGRLLATANEQGLTLHRLTAETKKVPFLEVDGAKHALFSPDTRILATSDGNKDVALWDVVTGKRRALLRCDGYYTYGLAFSPDSKWLASAGHDSKGLIWDVTTGKPIPGLSFGGGLAFAFSHDGKTLILANHWDSVLHFLDTKTHLQTGNANLVSGAASADGSLMALCTRDSRIMTWRVGREPGGRFVARHEHWGGTDRLFLSADGRSLLMEGLRLKGWDLVHRKVYAGEPWQYDLPRAASGDGRLLALFKLGKAEVWDLLARHRLQTLGDPANPIFGGEFSPDNNLLATRGKNPNLVQIWDLSSGKQRNTLQDSGSRGLRTLRFTPDGNYLLTTHDYGTSIHVLEVASGKEVHVHGGGREGAVSPDSKTLATGKWEGVRFRDLLTGKDQRLDLRFGPPRGMVRDLFWAPDGRHLVTVNQNGTVYVFRLAPGQGR
jgi:formylglycine-generating enzyme required for sulfatase activity/WD40 repeat protein